MAKTRNARPLGEGVNAPDFTAPTQGGGSVRLSSLRGKEVVLYFYPKDDTPGCTKEACGFRDAHEELKQRGVVVLGVSSDPVKSHDKFVRKYGLPFELVSDEDHSIAEAYGVWGEKTFMGRKYLGVHRCTFWIDGDGCIRRVWPQVKPEIHAAEVLAAVSEACP